MGLKCTMANCKYVIYAVTGLQEIDKLRAHFSKKHKLTISMERALEFRLAMEAGHAPDVVNKIGVDYGKIS